ncbi:MAG: hypothetical protein K8L91_07140 [Anaerolineae bacterium]|nr:hypothetical protein [Anaerolineae bacterium]
MTLANALVPMTPAMLHASNQWYAAQQEAAMLEQTKAVLNRLVHPSKPFVYRTAARECPSPKPLPSDVTLILPGSPESFEKVQERHIAALFTEQFVDPLDQDLFERVQARRQARRAAAQ